MPNPKSRLPQGQSFQLQQFSIQQKHSAMKVCLDALVFGCTSPSLNDLYVLDIGAGTGLLSLVCAQKGAQKVDAVEMDLGSSQDCLANFMDSPWAERLTLHHTPIQEFKPTLALYDLIISNPPYFKSGPQSQDQARAWARHTDRLSEEDLLTCVRFLLKESGSFYVMLPVDNIEVFKLKAIAQGLFLQERTWVHSAPHKDPHLAFLRLGCVQVEDLSECILYLKDEFGNYHESVIPYLQDYLLRFRVEK